jgi:hypothetical protein
MISSVKQAIVNKLLEIYPGATIYDEDVPQGFSKPSFLITLTDHDYGKRLNVIYKSRLSFDVAYLSDKSKAEINTDCQSVQLNLLRMFDLIGTFRVLNKKTITTDNVLHFTFDVNYSEIKTEIGVPMQTETTNTNI